MRTKHYIIAILSAFLLSGQSFAQPDIEKKGSFEEKDTYLQFLPPSFTSSGEVMILILNNLGVTEHFDVKDLNGDDVISIPNPRYSYEGHEYYSIISCDTTVVYDSESYPSDRGRVEYGEAFFTNLQDYVDYSDYSYVFFTTIDGREACCRDNGGFYNYELYGKKYPDFFYAIADDGYVHEYFAIYRQQFSNCKFSDTPYKSEESSYLPIPESLYLNLDIEVSGDFLAPAVSQTLFNDDENWEYFLIEGEPVLAETYISYDNKINPFLQKTYRINMTSINIVNDKGDVLLEIPVEQIPGCYASRLYFIWDCIKFIRSSKQDLIAITIPYMPYSSDGSSKNVTTIYSFDKGTSSVKEIARTESRMTVNTTDDNLDVRVLNAENGENVTLSDMSGRVVGRMPARSEGASFSTAGMSNGIYNVTLQGGESGENQKILIR